MSGREWRFVLDDNVDRYLLDKDFDRGRVAFVLRSMLDSGSVEQVPCQGVDNCWR